MRQSKKKVGWLYKEKEIHREWFEMFERKLPPKKRDWYYLIYSDKMSFLLELLKNFKGGKILDAGCGEGVLVEKLRKEGYNIEGLDPNYESSYVKNADITSPPYRENEFDVVLLLDVLEHIPYDKQYTALREIKRILKPGGTFVMSVPNLAHLSSRIKFLILGKLSRTDKDINHLGERTFHEYRELLIKHNFKIKKVFASTPSIPIIWQLITLYPEKLTKLYRAINLLATPQISILNIFVSENKK